MESKTIYFRVGVVILSGLAMLAALIVWVGSDAFRSAGRPFETYFAESVQGLEVGSPVRFRGVPIGRVTQIAMAYVFSVPLNIHALVGAANPAEFKANLEASEVRLTPAEVAWLELRSDE